MRGHRLANLSIVRPAEFTRDGGGRQGLERMVEAARWCARCECDAFRQGRYDAVREWHREHLWPLRDAAIAKVS